jgi:hypothetical protein
LSVASDVHKIHGPIDAGEQHFRFSERKKASDTPSFALAHVNAGPVYLQQLTAKTANL